MARWYYSLHFSRNSTHLNLSLYFSVSFNTLLCLLLRLQFQCSKTQQLLSLLSDTSAVSVKLTIITSYPDHLPWTSILDIPHLFPVIIANHVHKSYYCCRATADGRTHKVTGERFTRHQSAVTSFASKVRSQQQFNSKFKAEQLSSSRSSVSTSATYQSAQGHLKRRPEDPRQPCAERSPTHPINRYSPVQCRSPIKCSLRRRISHIT